MIKLKKFLTKQKEEILRVNPGQNKYEVVLGYLGVISGFISAISMTKNLLRKTKK